MSEVDAPRAALLPLRPCRSRSDISRSPKTVQLSHCRCRLVEGRPVDQGLIPVQAIGRIHWWLVVESLSLHLVVFVDVC